MYSIIYARRAFAKRTASFVSLFIILNLTFTTATAPLVLTDMVTFGDNIEMVAEAVARSGGSHFTIYNAREDYLQFFTGYDIFTAAYDKGKIRVNVTELTVENAEAVGTELWRIITEIGDTQLSLVGDYPAYLGQSQVDPETFTQTMVIVFSFLAVSLVSMLLALGDFMRRQERDFSALLSIGATHKKIGVILICEIIPVFAAAYMFALVLSNTLITGVVYSLDFYAQIQASGKIIFMSCHSLLLSFIFTAGTTAAAFLLKLNYLGRIPPVTLSSDEDDINPGFRRDNRMLNASSAAGALTHVCVRRDGRQYIRMGLLTAASVFISLFIPVYCYSGYAFVQIGDTDILLEHHNAETSMRENFTLSPQEEEVIAAMPPAVRNVEDVYINYRSYPQSIVIRVDKNTASAIEDDGNYFKYVWLTPVTGRMLEILKTGSEFDIEAALQENSCLLPISQKRKYKIGDIITIESNTSQAADADVQEHALEADHTHTYEYNHLTELVVTGFINRLSSDEVFEVYLSAENFKKAADGNYDIGNIFVYLANPADSATAPRIERYLRENGIELTVTDQFKQNRRGYESVTPILVLGIALCVFLYCATLITSWISIGGYIRSREKQLQILALLGADRRDLISPYMRQSAIYALPTVVLPMLLSTLANILLYRSFATTPTFGAVKAEIYAIIFTAGMLSYLLPAYISLKRVVAEC